MRIFLLILFLCLSVSGASGTWTGAVDSVWQNNGNWTGATYPQANTDTARFTSTYSNKCVLTANVTSRRVEMSNFDDTLHLGVYILEPY